MSSIEMILSENLQDACARAEAGFYFEEGGCFGMALAIHEALTDAQISSSLAMCSDIGHSVILVDDVALDYTGSRPRKDTDRPVSSSELKIFAENHGHDEQKLFSDQEWAREIIDATLSDFRKKPAANCRH